MTGHRSQRGSGAGDRRRGSRFICTGLAAVFACIAFLGADAPCNALPSKKAHIQASANSYPVIWAVYVGYHTLGDYNRVFPFDTDSVAIRAIIVASTDGVNKTAYTYLTGAPSDFGDGSQWHIEGVQGTEHAQYVSFGPGFSYEACYWFNELSSSSYDTIRPWPAGWGAPTFTWTHPKDACIQKCSTDCGRGAHRRYQFTEESSTLTGWGTNGRVLGHGTKRYRVQVEYLPPGMASDKKQTKCSPADAEATRISVRDSRNYGIVVPSTEPGKSDAERRINMLQWIHAYVDVPYEFGGSWFGGRIQSPPSVCDGGCDPCELYGMDCSHMVCVGAKWAGFNWTAGGEGGYYFSTSGLAGSYCGTDISYQVNLSDMVPGDIENWPDHHVRTIISYDSESDDLTTIAAEPMPEDQPAQQRVRQVVSDWSTDRAEGYIVRHLTAH